MSEIDPLTFRLIADMKAAQASISNLERTSDRSFSKLERDVLRVESQMKRSSGAIGASLKGLAGTLGTYFTGRELAGLIDSFTRLQNSLKVSGLEGTKLEAVQSRLLDLSTRYGVSVEGLANLYSKASDAGKGFGASQDQIVQLTEATSQALLITGTNAQQASGAILGLSQALASGTVRAEEFNQINEGGLRPLLQAAAATQRFGGDINKLRAAVVDGKLSSQEFFNSIMAGAAQLEGQASKATLTLSGAFEALTSKLTVYVGQSAQANGATAALADAIKLLADNLDTIIPALATIAAFMGTRMVVAAIAGSRAYAGFTAVLTGTATASATATAGLAALTAALTGPAGVALAITAVGAGLIYLGQQSEGTAESIKRLEDSNAQASDELDRMIGRLHAAGVQTDELAAAAARAKGPIDELADSYSRALIEARKFSNATAGGRIQGLSNTIRASQDRQTDLRQSIANAQRARALAGGGNAQAGATLDARIAGLRNELAAEIQKERLARVQIDVQVAGDRAGVDVNADPSRPTTGAAGKPKKTPRARAATDPLDAQFRNEQELRQYQLEELRAKEQAATAASEKAAYARDALVLERDGRIADVNEAVRKKQLSKDEAAARIKIIENLYGAADEITVQGREAAYQAAITRQEQEQIARQQTDAMRDELDALGAEAGVTDVRKARVEIERRMLEIQQEIERKLLDEAIARGDVLDAAQAHAALGRKQAAERESFQRDNMGPLGQYVEDLRKAGLNLDDQFENIAVNGLRSLNDGIADAIANSKNLGDVFKNVTQSIVADLIRIAIQQTIVNSLMGALGGLFGGGGLSIGNSGSSLKSSFKIPGRASGGPVEAGRLYRINESGMEGFVPATSGKIIPAGQMNARAASSSMRQGPIEIKVYAEEGAMFVPRVTAISQGEAVKVTMAAAPALTERAAQETTRRLSRPRMPGAGR